MNSSFRILIKSPKFMFGACMLLAMIGMVLIYPLFNRNDPLEMIALAYQPPDSKLLLGSDNFGRDLFLELIYGIRTSLQVGLIAGVFATVIGLVIGLASGYIGGMIDNLLTAITNIFIVIPSFVILILISVSIDSRSSFVTAVIIGITSWPWTARAVRAQTSSLRNRDHVNIAKISGYSTPRIIVSEILPYIASYVVMAFVLQTASGILSEASISMLGLGPYNTISLGIIMNWALVFEAPVAGAWWAFIPAAISIAIITFSLYMMNTGMDEIFNPKIRS
ncbi:ABC transporter permease [Paenibacillus lautus]|uniref:ABC transporter permease n=1 Tax=Paenibacillus lautus TaxID=1401 RepID=A0A2A5LIK8_PAELA|nr:MULTISPECIES: ABC transporter permease [Paenibacillus]MBY0162866.1 ABC transporter permease [Cytobacillus firmus]VTR59465.1 oligopeptide ABC transporter permease [Actinobacillus pleuropneumoniae]ACX63649.1 binding-protein-dependent transport systems inner membrane component [Paenibacillus sp. Y412MC10]AYB45946.1 ABC transporter permease [Paenibacillus lautus]EGG36304.1 ABC transporter, permease protein [Paenibacillus sp. HGF5]